MAVVDVAFRLLDVFGRGPLTGNQLCVVPDAAALDAPMMQAITREIGFSETTFVTAIGDAEYDVRIFVPGYEIPFAGHPTLGTAFTLVADGLVRSPLVQHCGAGAVPVEVDVATGTASMRQLQPTFGATGDVEDLARALGLRPEDLARDPAPEVVSTGIGHLMVCARDREAVARASPDKAALTPLLERLGTDGCYLFALDGETAKARMFAPGAGIDEDPATGSAAGPLGAYCLHHGLTSPGRLTVDQGDEIARPSTLLVDVERDGEAWSIAVSGQVALVGRGTFELPG